MEFAESKWARWRDPIETQDDIETIAIPFLRHATVDRGYRRQYAADDGVVLPTDQYDTRETEDLAHKLRFRPLVRILNSLASRALPLMAIPFPWVDGWARGSPGHWAWPHR